LQPQFERGEVRKEYIARVVGTPAKDHFDCRAPIRTSPQAAGARSVDPAGVTAHTDFELVRAEDSGSCLVRAIPRTGRTNQIRIHLWHLGLPVEGDPLYLPGGVLGGYQTLEVTSGPMCLHAFRITVQHPFTGDEITFEAPLPGWAGVS
jgi:23S rRNA-/tRNA-specific pseudouridylate synthase